MTATGHYSAQRRILSRLNPFLREPILDMACGTGYLLSILSRKFKRIQGNDFSEKMICLAKNNLGAKTAFSKKDASNIRSRKLFHTIISCNLFYYIQNQPKTLKCWKNILFNNGVLIFIEEHPFNRPKQKKMSDFKASLSGAIRPIPINEIISLAKAAGFHLLKKIKTSIDSKHDLYGLAFKKY